MPIDITVGTPGRYNVAQVANQTFLDQTVPSKRMLHCSRGKLELPGDANLERALTMSLGFQALHRCYAEHAPFGMTPDWVWYMIVHEVAEHVKQNARTYAGLFTDTPDAKQLIEVRDDTLVYDGPSDWGRTIGMFRTPLEEKLSGDIMSLFLPTFTTTTEEDEIAALVTFMDTISPYYDYLVRTRCDVPRIRLEGTTEDWASVLQRAGKLADTFPGLAAYFGDLLPVLEQLLDTARGNGRDNFWCSIYKQKNGSGGPYITGWITAFLAHTNDDNGLTPRTRFGWEDAWTGWGGLTPDEIPSHVSAVPFVWDYYGTKFPMKFAAGVFGVDNEDSFFTPQLGFAVLEMAQ